MIVTKMSAGGWLKPPEGCLSHVSSLLVKAHFVHGSHMDGASVVGDGSFCRILLLKRLREAELVSLRVYDLEAAQAPGMADWLDRNVGAFG